MRRVSIGVAIVGFMAAALVLVVHGPRPAAAQPGGCTLGARSTNARTGEPIVGMTKTLLETGAVTQTDDDGNWAFQVPGAGSYTVRSEHPDYVTATRRYVMDTRCRIVSDTAVGGSGAPNPDPSARPASTPRPTATPRPGSTPRPRTTPQPTFTPLPSAIPAGNSRFGGVLWLEGKVAPAGMRVNAFVGDVLCGAGRVFDEGRYAVDVLPAGQRRGCAATDTPVQLKALPSFGSPLTLGDTAPFSTDTLTERDVTWDPRQMAGEAENVPLIPITWAQPLTMRIGICGDITTSGEEAVRRAIGQWQEAYATQGLNVYLLADADTACGEDEPGIAVIEDELDEPDAIAGAGHLDRRFNPCRRNVACAAFKSLVVINRPTLSRLGAEEQANVLAHEIGHALGLGHARACTGATIMWEDTRCRYPMTVVGPDDIASLNRKVAPPVTFSHKEMEAAPGPLVGADARSAMSLPSLISVLAEGSVTMARPAQLDPGTMLER